MSPKIRGHVPLEPALVTISRLFLPVKQYLLREFNMGPAKLNRSYFKVFDDIFIDVSL